MKAKTKAKAKKAANKITQGIGSSKLVKWLTPVFAVLAIVFALQLLYGRRQVDFPELCPENGVLDVSGIDFSEQVFDIANKWDYYPNKLYNSADFASGVTEKPLLAGRDISTNGVPFGTYRLILKAEPNTFYAFCGFSLDYGTRVFVNGAETVNFGRVADNAEDAVPQGGYMTVPICTDENGMAEIIYQYSNFVHTEGGYIPATYMSAPQNIEEYKAGNTLISVGIGGAMLILTLYFLLCAVIQRQTGYLCLAFCCLLMALRDHIFLSSHLLPPDISWYFNYRLFIAVVSLIPASFLLLFENLYPVGKKWARFAYIGAAAADIILMLLFDTKKSVIFCTAAYFISFPYLIYVIFGMLRSFRGRRFRVSDLLSLGSMTVLIIALAADALLARRSSFATRYGFVPVAMLIFVLLNAVSVSIRVQAQKTALAESRSRSELLERMNAMNLDFFHKVAHELKTPLTVISGYAQLAGLQIADNKLSAETPENLKTIQQEAMRLADLVTRLMDYSYGTQTEVIFGAVQVASLLGGVQAVCAPMCMKNNNRVITENGGCADIYGNKELLLQIFINLAVNANRHTQNGVITISASDTESREYIVFRVSDTGGGIAKEHLPRLFEKGYSGDGGSGLGLSVCREAVEAQGGEIKLEKTGADGTVFAFTVPRNKSSE